MTDIFILLADNDMDFLATYGEFLASEGYNILKATSPVEAKEVLQTSRVHLAILDLRMENDSDEKDRSGLILAKSTARSVPKLILTRFPTYQDVVEALKPDLHNLPPAVDFLDKRKGLDELLAAVQQILAKHLQINWELIIHWERVLSFAQLVYLIEPELDRNYLVERMAELEDLFRKLFRKYSQITIARLLTHGQGYTILLIYVYAADGMERQYIVSCGRKALIQEELQKYQTAVSPRIDVASISHDMAEKTIRFAANAYHLVQNNTEEPITLKEVYQRYPEENMHNALERLYRVTLRTWYEKDRYFNREETIHAFYQGWLKRNAPALTEQAMQQRIQALCANALRSGLGQIEYSAHTLTLHSPTEDTIIKYPNPVNYWHEKRHVGNHFTQWGMTHGRINLNTVLLARNGRICPIDFTQVGKAPLLHDFVSLETAVKHHLSHKLPLTDQHTMENKLSSLVSLSDDLENNILPETIRHITRTVIQIRHLAAEQTDCSYEAYLNGLFFFALNHLGAYQPTIHYTRHTLAQYTHALLISATICQKLAGTPSKQDILPNQANQKLWIDKDNKIVWVEGAQIDLTIQDFQILTYLYNHVGQLCERQAIITQGLGEEYDEYYQEESRLNSAMSRLRQKIEPNPQNPRYLITVRGRGYKLLL